MPLLGLARFVAAIVSLLILAAAAYLLWSWWDGRVVLTASGDAVRIRDDWRLWMGGALFAWSFLGRFIVPLLVARPDTRPTSAVRREGQTIAGASGADLYVERAGSNDAPTIILTHGWGMDSTFWNYAKEDLGRHFQVVAWDLPGLGKSRLPADGQVSLERMAADLAALATLSGAAPPVLVGHSIGGMIIQTVLRDHPQLRERIAGVVLLNTTYANPLRTMVLSRLALALQKPVLEPMMRLTVLMQPLVWLSKWQSYLSGSSHLAHRLGFGRYVTRSQLEHATLLSTRSPPGVEAKGNLAMFHWDSGNALQDLPRSALVVGGDLDIVTKLEASQALAGQNPLAVLEVVDGVNHLGPLERADLYNAAIARFTEAVQPSVTLHDSVEALADAPPPRRGASEARPLH